MPADCFNKLRHLKDLTKILLTSSQICNLSICSLSWMVISTEFQAWPLDVLGCSWTFLYSLKKNLASTSYFSVQFWAVDYTAELTVQLSHSWGFIMLSWTASLIWQVHTIPILTCMFPNPSYQWSNFHKEDGKKARQGKARGRERERQGKSLPVTQVSRVQGWCINLGLCFTLSLLQNSHRCQLKICTYLRHAHGVDLPRCLILLN